jgi:hypothetical protein
MQAGRCMYLVDTISDLIESAVIDVSDIATSTDLAAPTGASLIGYTPTGLLTATTVEGALNEVRDASKVSYTPAGTGAVATNVQTKLREWVSVTDFGGVGDGVTDNSSAIEAAQAESQNVYFPRGQYRITRPIIWLNGWLIGQVDNGSLSLSNNQTMILADGTFPAFQYDHPGGFNSHGGGIKNFNIYFADGTEPSTISTRPNAIGFLCDGSSGYPAFHTIENITVRGGQWAVFDTSGSWMAKYAHIHSDNTIGGIYKRYGTTHALENCYHRNGRAGFYFQDVLGVTLTGCAVDLVDVNTSGYYAFFVENSEVVANGCDFELITVAADYREIVRVNGSNAFLQMNGCRFLDSTINAATEVYCVYATNGAKVELNGVNFTPTNYVGSTGVFAYLAALSGAIIDVNQSTFPTLIGGTPSSSYTALATTGSVSYNGCISTYQWQGNSRKSLLGITASVFYDFGTITASTGSGTNQTVTGAALGDFVVVSPQTAIPSYIILFAQVVAANTVNVTAYNVGTASQVVGAIAVNIRVIQP